jgi:hypothetical protein
MRVAAHRARPRCWRNIDPRDFRPGDRPAQRILERLIARLAPLGAPYGAMISSPGKYVR